MQLGPTLRRSSSNGQIAHTWRQPLPPIPQHTAPTADDTACADRPGGKDVRRPEKGKRGH